MTPMYRIFHPRLGHCLTNRDLQLEKAYHRTRTSLDQSLDLIQSLQEELDAMREELAWSNRLGTLGTMSAIIAHEFNNLLMPIGAYAQLALADPDDAGKTQQALQAASNGVAQVGRLADMILGFAKMSKQDDAAILRLDRVVEQSIACVKPALDQSQVEVVCHGIDHLQPAIQPLALQQVLVNLIHNAERAMRNSKGKRVIYLSAKKNDESFALTVCDTGPGVPKEIRKTLFEPFKTKQTIKSNDSIDSLKNVGTGLGLSICKMLIESAGGTIELITDHEAGQGACFQIKLPFAA